VLIGHHSTSRLTSVGIAACLPLFTVIPVSSARPLSTTYLTFQERSEKGGTLATTDEALSKACRLASTYLPALQKFSSSIQVPFTAGNLITYTLHVQPFQHGATDSDGHYNDGKLNPKRYGSIKELDLGLCYEAFFTKQTCRFRSQCRWRHDGLTEDKIVWMVSLGTKAEAIAWMHTCWRSPSKSQLTPWFPPCMFID
jgi:hypothetical protein